MKKFLILLMLIIALPVFADEFTLSAGVSVNEIPKEFFGSWNVSGKLEYTNNYSTFKPQSSDMWVLSRIGEVVTLSNPFTGANATISLKAVEGNLVVFSRITSYDNKVLTDTVSIRLDNNKFTGVNTLKLELFSLIDNHLMKTETARYIIKGEKIAEENDLK